MTNQDDTDHAWNQKEESERRREDDELSNTLIDIASCHKMLSQDPEYSIWSDKIADESREHQDSHDPF